MSLYLKPFELRGQDWVHRSEANKLSNSEGTRKLRCDLIQLFGEKLTPDEKKNIDLSNNFLVALEDNEIEEFLHGKNPGKIRK